MSDLNLADYDYHLPEELIAQKPIEPRDNAKLLVYDTAADKVSIDTFLNLDQYLPSPSLLVFNNTKVLPARLTVHKETGGKVELLLLVNEFTDQDEYVKALSDRKIIPGQILRLDQEHTFTVSGQDEKIFFLKLNFDRSLLPSLLLEYGITPIPKYLGETALAEDQLRLRYQSMFAEKPVGLSPIEIKKLKFFIKEFGNSLTISSCHPRRFDPPITWLKQKLGNKKWVEKHLGDIKHFSFDFWYHEVGDHPESQWKKKRSLLLDHFGHEIDLMRFLFNSNKKKEISAKRVADSYDEYQVTGTLCDISFAFTGYRKDKKEVYNESIRIDGTKGSLVINLNKGIAFFIGTAKIITVPKISYVYRFKQVTSNFIDAITKGTPVYLTHKDIIINNLVGVDIKKYGSYN